MIVASQELRTPAPAQHRLRAGATALTLTPRQAKYFAHDLTRRATGMDRLSMALFDAAVVLNRQE